MWIWHHISSSSQCRATEATPKVTVPVRKMFFGILLLDPLWQNNCTSGLRYTALTVKGMLAMSQSCSQYKTVSAIQWLEIVPGKQVIDIVQLIQVNICLCWMGEWNYFFFFFLMNKL